MDSDDKLVEGRHDELYSKQRLEDVLKSLERYNLEGRICSELAQTKSIGGFSDIFIGSFADGIEPSDSLCLVCHVRKSKSSEIACKTCQTVWGGRLAVKQFRVHIENKDHWKIIAKELFIYSKLL